MSREPSYPDDAPVRASSPAESAVQVEKNDAGLTKKLVTGAAIGIGSAAIVAALLYANRSRGNDKRSR